MEIQKKLITKTYNLLVSEMREIVYLEMFDEVMKIDDMEHTLNVVDESYGDGEKYYWWYDVEVSPKALDGFFRKEYGFKDKVSELIYEIQYKLSCFYESGHVLNDCRLGRDGVSEIRWANDNIKQIKNWIKKWKKYKVEVGE